MCARLYAEQGGCVFGGSGCVSAGRVCAGLLPCTVAEDVAQALSWQPVAFTLTSV
jgi:hypothetical protein